MPSTSDTVQSFSGPGVQAYRVGSSRPPIRMALPSGGRQSCTMRGRVLVLEHHRDLREALVEALLDEDYMVTPAPNVEAARQAIRSAADAQLPDVMVVDASDGRDLLAAVRSDPRCLHVALVTLSFRFDPPSDADVDLRRPFRLDQFLAAVHGALERQRGAAEPPADPRS